MLLQIKQWIGESKGSLLVYIGAISFLLGIACSFLFVVSMYVPLVLILLGGIFIAVSFVKRDQFGVLVLAIVLSAFALGCVRVLLVPDVADPFATFDGKPAIVEGEVISDPQMRSSGVQVEIETASIDGKKVRGVLLVRLPVGASVSYGDFVRVRGKIELPKVFLTDEGSMFDYPNYLRAKGVGATMNSQFLQILEPHSLSLFGFLYDFKHAFMRLVERTIPEPESSFLEGMLLGNRDALSDDLRDVFVTAGLVHIVVLSGYNLTLVADVFMKVSLFFLPRLGALMASAGSIVLFACMAGLDATVVRASIMALIVLLAKALVRPNLIMRSLTLACVLMVLYNPHTLLFDPSFVLSFLATFGLVTLSGPFERVLTKLPKKFSFREIASATLATQVFVFPILIFYTGTFSLIALPANLLALPLVPYAMLGGFIASCIGILGPVVSLPFAFIAWGLLGAIISITKVSASIPFASIDVSFIQTPLLLALYFLLVPLSLYAWQKNEREKPKQKSA